MVSHLLHVLIDDDQHVDVCLEVRSYLKVCLAHCRLACPSARASRSFLDPLKSHFCKSLQAVAFPLLNFNHSWHEIISAFRPNRFTGRKNLKLPSRRHGQTIPRISRAAINHDRRVEQDLTSVTQQEHRAKDNDVRMDSLPQHCPHFT